MLLLVVTSICYLYGYHMAELLRTKDEAPGAWKRMLLRIRTLGFSVHVLRIDNDSVLLGAEFRAVCDDFGVDIQRSAPYRHHQLARIERHWRTISDAVTALLADADLAKGFWGYAFLTVAYVRNRVWHSGANCIPFQRVSGAGPDLTNLRVFGCPAYVHIESSRRKKLDPKARKGIFVGYVVDSPVYLVYNPAARSLSAHRMLLLMRPGFLLSGGHRIWGRAPPLALLWKFCPPPLRLTAPTHRRYLLLLPPLHLDWGRHLDTLVSYTVFWPAHDCARCERMRTHRLYNPRSHQGLCARKYARKCARMRSMLLTAYAF